MSVHFYEVPSVHLNNSYIYFKIHIYKIISILAFRMERMFRFKSSLPRGQCLCCWAVNTALYENMNIDVTGWQLLSCSHCLCRVKYLIGSWGVEDGATHY